MPRKNHGLERASQACTAAGVRLQGTVDDLTAAALSDASHSEVEQLWQKRQEALIEHSAAQERWEQECRKAGLRLQIGS